jgi:hypothetical protein
MDSAFGSLRTRESLVVVVRLKADLHALWSLFKSAATNRMNDSFRVKRLSFSLTICGICGRELECQQKKVEGRSLRVSGAAVL